MSKTNEATTATATATALTIGESYLHDDHGIVTLTAQAKGWCTIEDEDGEEHKVRATTLQPNPELSEDDCEDDESAASKMAETLNKYRTRYVPTLSAKGKKSLCNGDPLALLLSGLDLPALFAMAASVGLVDCEERYQSLNPGQKRMNVGNRLRAMVRKGAATIDGNALVLVEQPAE